MVCLGKHGGTSACERGNQLEHGNGRIADECSQDGRFASSAQFLSPWIDDIEGGYSLSSRRISLVILAM